MVNKLALIPPLFWTFSAGMAEQTPDEQYPDSQKRTSTCS
jgi:hypothetical protein